MAVVTGGGTGMGRELVVQLAAAGCSVAACDVHTDTLEETRDLARKGAPSGVRVSIHQCDVASEQELERFREEMRAEHGVDSINLLFNNAGIGGGGSFVAGDRDEWERVFAIDFYGVYYSCRVFMPLLMAADEGIVVNTSSVNGFWATLGLGMPHTSYSTAKFAVKGFTESLIQDFRSNAPHLKAAVVMPGHIGTEIVLNSARVLYKPGVENETVAQAKMMGTFFRDNAPLSPAQAAEIILEDVRTGKWRILVGEDAKKLDARVRADPESAYESITLFEALDQSPE